jgi:hypothetical protein
MSTSQSHVAGLVQRHLSPSPPLARPLAPGLAGVRFANLTALHRLHFLLLSGVLIAIITFGSPLPALLEADKTGDIKVQHATAAAAAAAVAMVERNTWLNAYHQLC